MTTTVIGQLPCPECHTTQPLSSDGRKHTLKCDHCGLLAYYQSQQAKDHIEARLKQKATTPVTADTATRIQPLLLSNGGQSITLALPEGVERQAYQMIVQRQATEEGQTIGLGHRNPSHPNLSKGVGWQHWRIGFEGSLVGQRYRLIKPT